MFSLGINLHGGTNDILTNANHEEIARNIIKIGLNCKTMVLMMLLSLMF